MARTPPPFTALTVFITTQMASSWREAGPKTAYSGAQQRLRGSPVNQGFMDHSHIRTVGINPRSEAQTRGIIPTHTDRPLGIRDPEALMRPRHIRPRAWMASVSPRAPRRPPQDITSGQRLRRDTGQMPSIGAVSSMDPTVLGTAKGKHFVRFSLLPPDTGKISTGNTKES